MGRDQKRENEKSDRFKRDRREKRNDGPRDEEMGPGGGERDKFPKQSESDRQKRPRRDRGSRKRTKEIGDEPEKRSEPDLLSARQAVDKKKSESNPPRSKLREESETTER